MGNSLAVYWLEAGTFSAVVWGSVFGQGTKIPTSQAVRQKKKKKSKLRCAVNIKYTLILKICYQA